MPKKKNEEVELEQMQEILAQYEHDFSVNRTRIKELKELLVISSDPQRYEAFKREKKKQINTLNLKAELSKLVIRNERLKESISALREALMGYGL